MLAILSLGITFFHLCFKEFGFLVARPEINFHKKLKPFDIFNAFPFLK